MRGSGSVLTCELVAGRFVHPAAGFQVVRVLEFLDCLDGLLIQTAVDLAGVEPQVVQPGLDARSLGHRVDGAELQRVLLVTLLTNDEPALLGVRWYRVAQAP